MPFCQYSSAWLQCLEQYDQVTYRHSLRTASFFVRFADYAGVGYSALRFLYAGAALHDVGKLAVPVEILQKKDSLNDCEFDLIRKHPEYAYQWMAASRNSDAVTQIPYLHHERWDGCGYPLGLTGTNIPYFVRLFSVIDVWEAMSVSRPYRKAIPERLVLRHLDQSSGVLFDPDVVDKFLSWRRSSVVINAGLPSVIDLIDPEQGLENWLL
jgi:HD-GYP domain-containing protein (c-di-GMP phosphodiesterase class II)